MYALYNVRTKKFYVRENEYRNCVEVDKFIDAKNFKDIKDAYYLENLLKADYVVIDHNKAIEMNKFMCR